MRYTYSITYKKPELDTITPMPSNTSTTPSTTPGPTFPSSLNRKNMRYTITHGMPVPSSDDTASTPPLPPPTISITPPRTPSPTSSSSLTLNPHSHLPFRSLRAKIPVRPLLRKRSRPAAPLIFPATMWRDACPTEPPVPVRASFPFHMPAVDLMIDTVLANATPQVLHINAPRRANFDRCPSAWQSHLIDLTIDTVLANATPQALEVSAPRQAEFGRCPPTWHSSSPANAKLEGQESLDSLMDKLAALAQRRQRRREQAIRHAQPKPYSAEARSIQKLVRHREAVEAVNASLAALELAMKKTEKKLEDLESSDWYLDADADASSLVVENADWDDDESEYQWLLVSDTVDGDDAELVESGEDDEVAGFEKLVGIVAEDSDCETTLERRKSFEILGSLL